MGGHVCEGETKAGTQKGGFLKRLQSSIIDNFQKASLRGHIRLDIGKILGGNPHRYLSIAHLVNDFNSLNPEKLGSPGQGYSATGFANQHYSTLPSFLWEKFSVAVSRMFGYEETKPIELKIFKTKIKPQQ